MSRLSAKLWAVQLVSVFRLAAALAFAALAFQAVPAIIVATLYGVAMSSDLIDGLLARRFVLQSYTGTIIDIISDKSLTVISLLYAAARGIHLFPLAIIAAREVIVIGLRAVVIDRVQVLPTNRVFGGLMALLLWGNTLLLVIVPEKSRGFGFSETIYWLAAIMYAANLVIRIYVSRQRLMVSLTKAGQPDRSLQ